MRRLTLGPRCSSGRSDGSRRRASGGLEGGQIAERGQALCAGALRLEFVAATSGDIGHVEVDHRPICGYCVGMVDSWSMYCACSAGNGGCLGDHERLVGRELCVPCAEIAGDRSRQARAWRSRRRRSNPRRPHPDSRCPMSGSTVRRGGVDRPDVRHVGCATVTILSWMCR